MNRDLLQIIPKQLRFVARTRSKPRATRESQRRVVANTRPFENTEKNMEPAVGFERRTCASALRWLDSADAAPLSGTNPGMTDRKNRARCHHPRHLRNSRPAHLGDMLADYLRTRTLCSFWTTAAGPAIDERIYVSALMFRCQYSGVFDCLKAYPEDTAPIACASRPQISQRRGVSHAVASSFRFLTLRG
jgi:hypothetical protein